MPTVTFTVASAADDGDIIRNGSWPPAGSYTVGDGTVAFSANDSPSSGNYNTYVALFRWDTSSIPDNATIISATFITWCHQRGEADTPGTYSVVGDYYDFGGEPSDGSDWTFVCSPSIFTAFTIASMPSSDIAYRLPLTDLTGINKSGYTGIRVSLDNPTPPGLSNL